MSADQTPDGVLIALCDEYHSNRLETDTLWEDGPPTDGTSEADRSAELVARYHEIREELADLAAETPAGLQAKAGVLLFEFEGQDKPGDYPNQYSLEGALVLSLARDIIGRPAA